MVPAYENRGPFFSFGMLVAAVLALCSSGGWKPWTEPSAPTRPSAGQRALVVPGLEEPLVATSQTSAAEDTALGSAIASFRAFTPPSSGADVRLAIRPLETFAANNPHSGWAASVNTNLGLAYYKGGYFSRALDAFSDAWSEGRTATDARAKTVVDRAFSELAKMHARLGHVEALEALLTELGDRPMTGTATELLQGAREGVYTMRHDPGVGFLCGPRALENLLSTLGASAEARAIVDSARSGEHGFTLAQVDALATRAKLPHRIVYRAPGQAVPVPSVINWKSHHYAAITGRDGNGRFHLKDPTFALDSDLSVTQAAIDDESTGFFLVPAGASPDRGSGAWRTVTPDEAASAYGMGSPQNTDNRSTRQQDPKKNACQAPTIGEAQPSQSLPTNVGGTNACCTSPMCMPDAHLVTVSLTLNDTPVGYAPQVGPPVFSRLTFNQREAGQPTTFGFFNVSPKWTLNWLSYIQDDLTAGPGANVTRYISGGGYESYAGFNGATGAFAGEVETGMVLTRIPAKGPLTSYALVANDGSQLVYAQPDGASSGTRRVFLSKVIDPQGNALTLNYDTALAAPTIDAGVPLLDASADAAADAAPPPPPAFEPRLSSITDAEGRSTLFAYAAADPLLLTSITDPFGRKATIAYDGAGHLASITDILGITSSPTYDASGIVNSLTTPYGTSRFAYAFKECTGTTRCLELTDTLGNTERVEYFDGQSLVAGSDPVVPSGINYQDSYLNYRSTYYWDRHAYPQYGQVSGKDYNMAVHYHFMHRDGNYTGWAIESIKRPLESRIWYNRGNGYYSFESPNAAGDAVNAVARLLPDGSTQLTSATLNTTGKPATLTDASGRVTKFTYDKANDFDLLQVQQAMGTNTFATLSSYGPYVNHQPQSYTDTSGQKWSYAYNAKGQPSTVTNPKNETITYTYDSPQGGRLLSVADALGNTTLSFTYPANCDAQSGRNCDLPDSVTDAVGGTTSFTYDAYDRVVATTYPDGSSDANDYTFQPGAPSAGGQSLDLRRHTDQQGHVTVYAYDGERRLASTTDPNTHTVHYGYYPNGILHTLKDENGNTTTWNIDVQNRPIAKVFADRSQNAYAYDSAGRLQSVTDGLFQLKTFQYNPDDTVAAITYSNSVNPTPSVSFAYDRFFPRRTSMADGTGTTTYAYYPIASPPVLGGGRLQTVVSPVAGTVTPPVVPDGGQPDSGATDAGPQSGVFDTIAYGYDELGRVASRTVNGAAETVGFDALGRVTAITNALDAFIYAYADPTPRLAGITSTKGPKVALNYYPPSGNEWLQQMTYTAAGTGSRLSQYGYTYDHQGNVLTFTERYLGQKFEDPRGDAGGTGGLLPPLRKNPRQDANAREARTPHLPPSLLLAAGTGFLFALFALTRRTTTRHARWWPALASMLALLPFAACGGDDSQGGPTVVDAGVADTTAPPATPSAQVTTYGYDPAYRLLSAAVGTDVAPPPSPQYQYVYDPASNPTSIAANSPAQTRNYTDTNAIIGGVYDLNGSPLSLEGASYTWDAENRILSATVNGVESDFSYDGASRIVRIVEKVAGAVTSDKAYGWDDAKRVNERDNLQGGSPITKQYFAQGYLLASGAQYYYATDQLGSVRQLVDATGAISAQYGYDPYGNPTTVAGGSLDNDFGYAGYFRHVQSGLDLTVYRAYSSRQARWTSRDPIGESGGITLYEYTASEPTRYTDALGLDETLWWNRTGGRSVTSGPTNGNWGGGCWSGGQYSCDGHAMGTKPPTDSGDACYKDHDECYDKCPQGNKVQLAACKKACDSALVKSLKKLDSDPKKWPNPPRKGTEKDSLKYRDDAIWYFE